MPKGSPLALEERPSPEPDTTEVYPMLLGLADPAGPLAAGTLRWIEQLWNQRWDSGGYPRYNATSEDNPPASWPIASMLVARAYALAGDDAAVAPDKTALLPGDGGRAEISAGALAMLARGDGGLVEVRAVHSGILRGPEPATP